MKRSGPFIYLREEEEEKTKKRKLKKKPKKKVNHRKPAPKINQVDIINSESIELEEVKAISEISNQPLELEEISSKEGENFVSDESFPQEIIIVQQLDEIDEIDENKSTKDSESDGPVSKSIKEESVPKQTKRKPKFEEDDWRNYLYEDFLFLISF